MATKLADVLKKECIMTLMICDDTRSLQFILLSSKLHVKSIAYILFIKEYPLHCLFQQIKSATYVHSKSLDMTAVPTVYLVSLHSLCDRNKAEQFVRGDLNLYGRHF